MRVVHFVGGPRSGEVEHVPFDYMTQDYMRVVWLEPLSAPSYSSWEYVNAATLYTADYEIRSLKGYYVGVCVRGCTDPYAT